MFSFLNRSSAKSPTTENVSNTLPLPFETNVDIPPPLPRLQQRQSSVKQEEPPPPQQAIPDPRPVVAAVPSPHDTAISEVHAKLLQIEQLTQMGCSPPTSTGDPLSVNTSRPTAEPLYDPATGIQRGFFEPASMSGENEQSPDETWSQLAHIRELQSEIATMHMRMEGFGDGINSGDVEVDVDVDVDTVQSQEEEEASKREKEFTKLPGRFKGRSDEIDAIMAKLDVLSQALNTFHSLQPPPLNFESPATSRESTFNVPPSREPPSARARTGILATVSGKKVGLDQNQIAEALQDSPLSSHSIPFPLNNSSK